MSKEKREKRVYEAIGPVAQQFGVSVVLGVAVPFQRMDNGATVWVSIETMTCMRAVIRFNGALERGLHDGEAISGEYDGTTQMATLVTWFKL